MECARAVSSGIEGSGTFSSGVPEVPAGTGGLKKRVMSWESLRAAEARSCCFLGRPLAAAFWPGWGSPLCPLLLGASPWDPEGDVLPSWSWSLHGRLGDICGSLCLGCLALVFSSSSEADWKGWVSLGSPAPTRLGLSCAGREEGLCVDTRTRRAQPCLWSTFWGVPGKGRHLPGWPHRVQMGGRWDVVLIGLWGHGQGPMAADGVPCAVRLQLLRGSVNLSHLREVR